MNIAVITTFPNNSWDVYAKKMLQNFVKFWPEEISLLVQLDNDLLENDIKAILRPQDCVATGWDKAHAEFVARNKDKDHPTDYRKQATRFCHKVFAIKRALDAEINAKKNNLPDVPRYLIWMDADVITTQPVFMGDIEACLPKDGDAVAYLGRKDWDHSECGWLAFDLDNDGDKLINEVIHQYVSDTVFKMEQWHDSWVWDAYLRRDSQYSCTNLTADKPGTEIWEQSPMAKWSTHYKGPVAKNKLLNQETPKPKQQQQKVIIQTMNAIPNEQIISHIEQNQALIKNWVNLCEPTDEEIVVVSAGPMLVAEDVRAEVKEGRRIVAVKHALQPLKKAGITPWACILLDPRPHVADFVKDADTDVIWFVASQVNPEVTKTLLAKGCIVWGYHASVGAGEHVVTKKQEHAIISGGSATATRGLFMLHHLGFKNFRLYGYDLCFPDKPDLEAKDDRGQPKYLEISLGMNDPLYNIKRCFWSEPQLIAQFEEMSELIKTKKFNLEAFGEGVLPFIIKSQRISNLRNADLKAKIYGELLPSYNELLNDKVLEGSLE